MREVYYGHVNSHSFLSSTTLLLLKFVTVVTLTPLPSYKLTYSPTLAQFVHSPVTHTHTRQNQAMSTANQQSLKELNKTSTDQSGHEGEADVHNVGREHGDKPVVVL